MNHLRAHLAELGIESCAAAPLSALKVINPSLLSRKAPFTTSVLVFLIPYRTDEEEKTNLSMYARSRDYHLFTQELEDALFTALSAQFPNAHFALFCDHSPIDERDAAMKCGLGVIGDNHLLITPKYGSYVFLGALFTDLALEFDALIEENPGCLHCGACEKACPSRENCLSAITQKKGELTAKEADLMRKTGTVWGCDICQIVCPMNRDKEETIIPFFRAARVAFLTKEALDGMDEETFKARAYAWRGRKTIERNLDLIEKDALS